MFVVAHHSKVVCRV